MVPNSEPLRRPGSTANHAPAVRSDQGHAHYYSLPLQLRYLNREYPSIQPGSGAKDADGVLIVRPAPAFSFLTHTHTHTYLCEVPRIPTSVTAADD